MPWFVYYTVIVDATGKQETLVAGPYSDSEAIEKRAEIKTWRNVTEAHIGDWNDRPKPE